MVGTCWQVHGVRHHPMEISVIIQKPSAWGDWATAKNLAWVKVQYFTGLWMQRWSCLGFKAATCWVCSFHPSHALGDPNYIGQLSDLSFDAAWR